MGLQIDVVYNGHKLHTWYCRVYVDNKLVAMESAKTEPAAEKLKEKLLKKLIIDLVRRDRLVNKTLNKLMGIEEETGFSGTGHYDD